MKKTLLLVLMIAFAMTGTAVAQSLPSYYPAKGFQQTGIVDAVYADEGRIVIGDISYTISPAAVVHSLSSSSDSMARVRKGRHVGFKTVGGDVIKEFWLLPKNYRAPGRR
ncbi:MAG: hypothetical protein OEQ90_08695 [Gammaproteobacteria bacterium]|nr:hypothetical protein [Gammaproteobacteria bacterium]